MSSAGKSSRKELVAAKGGDELPAELSVVSGNNNTH